MVKREPDPLQVLVDEAGWWKGTVAEWWALPVETSDLIAFHETGCFVACCTWDRPVNCSHTECQIYRGELPKIAAMNRTLRYEAQSGWLRFTSRPKLARLFMAYRKAARAAGVYDPWQLDWQGIVYTGVTVS